MILLEKQGRYRQIWHTRKNEFYKIVSCIISANLKNESYNKLMPLYYESNKTIFWYSNVKLQRLQVAKIEQFCLYSRDYDTIHL